MTAPPAAGAGSSPAIEAADLAFAFGAREVLAGVGLAVAPGELVGVVGPNGSGKSTLVRLLAGLAVPRTGEVRLEGRPLAAWPRRERACRLALVPQDPRLDFAFTVLEVALMGRAPHLASLGFAGARDLAIAREALARLEVGHLEHRSVDALSGGERQRVFLARALAQEPAVLLLDEPTTHLDLRHQTGLHDLVRARCAERGLAVVSVLHDLNLAAAFCDRVLVLERGRAAAVGTPAEVFRPDLLARVFDAPVHVERHPLTGLPVVLPRGTPGPRAVRASGSSGSASGR